MPVPKDEEALEDENPVLARAKEKGVSHLVRKLKQRETFILQKKGKAIRLVDTEIEVVDPQKSVGQLMKAFGLEQLPAPNKKAEREFDASVERLMQKARDAGNKWPDAKLRKRIVEKLKPRYQGLVNHASTER